MTRTAVTCDLCGHEIPQEIIEITHTNGQITILRQRQPQRWRSTNSETLQACGFDCGLKMVSRLLAGLRAGPAQTEWRNNERD